MLDNRYSCGPCRKRPNWDANNLKDALVGRSHKATNCVERVKEINKLQRELLKLPDDFKMGIVIGSDTAAVEMALWNLLGERGVDVISFDEFGRKWYKDCAENLKLGDVKKLDNKNDADTDRDVIFCYNGTTSGKYIGNLDWIKKDRKGLTICDATSAAFAYNIDWSKIDVLTYSWQKVLAGEAGFGVIVCSPRVFERLEKYKADRPIPELLNMRNKSLFEDGMTINTISMLCVEDIKDALLWAKSIDLVKKTEENANYVYKRISESKYLKPNIENPQEQSKTSITFTLKDKTEEQIKEIVEKVVKDFAERKIAVDFKGYRTEAPGFRIWTGPTIDFDGLKFLFDEMEKFLGGIL